MILLEENVACNAKRRIYSCALKGASVMFDILYLHDDFVVLNKHPNVSVHKDDGDTMLLHEVAKELGEDQLYLVHRLDKMTSGILLLARNAPAAALLCKKFADRTIDKFYLAIGESKPRKKQGTISGDMARSRRSSWKLLPSQHSPAITQFFSNSGEPGERLFLCKPYTGKTHQIRVALKSISSSILGDPIYNPQSKADRGYLHAFAIQFDYLSNNYQFVCRPNKGQKWKTEAVEEALEQWHSPWKLNWPKIK